MPEPEDRLREVFEAVLRRPAEQRRAFLEHLCDGDAGQIGAVWKLIEAHESAPSFPKAPDPEVRAAGPRKTMPASPSELLPFRLTLEQAQEQASAWLSKNAQDATSLSLRATYIPYFLFTMKAHATYRGARGNHSNYPLEQRGTEIEWAPKDGAIALTPEDLHVPALEALPNAHVDRLEFGIYADLRRLDPAVPLEFEALPSTRSSSAARKIAMSELRASLEFAVRRDIGGPSQRIDHLGVDAQAVAERFVLLPVFTGTYHARGAQHAFAIDGHGGQLAPAVLHRELGVLGQWLAGICAAIALTCLIVVFGLFLGYEPQESLGFVAIMVSFGLTFGAYVWLSSWLWSPAVFVACAGLAAVQYAALWWCGVSEEQLYGVVALNVVMLVLLLGSCFPRRKARKRRSGKGQSERAERPAEVRRQETRRAK